MTSNDVPLVHEVLLRAADERPSQPWLRFTDGETHTLAELAGRVKRVAAGLQRAGVGKGDRVALVADNRVEFVETWFAAHLVGAIVAPINVSMRGEVLEHMLDLISPKVVVVDGRLLERVLAIAGDRGYLETVAVIGDDSALGRAAGVLPYRDLGAAGEPEPVALDLTDPSSIMFTSGTTGPSKGIVWIHGSTWHMAEIPRRSMGYDERDSIYSCLPLFHATALINSMFVSLVAGARIVIAPRFSVSGFWADIHDSQATATPFLGAMTPLLIGREPDDQERGHRLRTGMMVPARAAERSVFRERFGVEVVEPYGLTDYGWLAWPSAGEPVPAGSVGRPHESFEVKIVDDRDREVSPGVPGEVIARAREPWTAPTGYWGMPEETLRSRRNLWFHTGDLLRSDEDGYLYFVDRGKDAMRRRGENVSSFEVERAVMAHPDVEDCAAYAVTSDLTEDEIAIAVVFVEGRRADPAAVLASIESRLPYFAVPRYVRIMSALPRTQTEKVVKSELRDAGITADTWDGDAAGFRVTR